MGIALATSSQYSRIPRFSEDLILPLVGQSIKSHRVDGGKKDRFLPHVVHEVKVQCLCNEI